MEQKRRKKSISGLLKHKKTYQGQHRVLSDWAREWHSDQALTIELIYSAMKENRREEAFRYMDQLRTITDKRFIGLCNVINIVSDPSRHLLDEVDLDRLSEESLNPSKENMNHMDDTDQTHMDHNQYTLNKKPIVDLTRIDEVDVDEIVKGYKTGMGVKELAERNGIGWQKITKILVTNNVYSSETYDKVRAFREEGRSDWEIMDLLDIGPKTLNIYTPYTKGLYNSKK